MRAVKNEPPNPRRAVLKRAMHIPFLHFLCFIPSIYTSEFQKMSNIMCKVNTILHFSMTLSEKDNCFRGRYDTCLAGEAE